VGATAWIALSKLSKVWVGAGHDDLERLVIVVATDLTLRHSPSSRQLLVVVDGIVAGRSTLTWKRSCRSVSVSEIRAPHRRQTSTLAGSAVASR
jgi:hypothetical protein